MNLRQLERELSGKPVRSLQHMLSRLALIHPWLPAPAVDGVFGEKTLEAVMIFQREQHPPVTGVVDRDTFTAIRALWLEAEQKLSLCRPVRGFPEEGYRAEPGEEALFLILPQTMFQVLSRVFSGLTAGEADGCHRGCWVDNVKWLQRVCGLEESGVLDLTAWNLLCRLYEAVVVWAPVPGSRPPFSGGWG